MLNDTTSFPILSLQNDMTINMIGKCKDQIQTFSPLEMDDGPKSPE